MLSTHRFVQHRARAIVALLMLAIVAMALAACGGSDGGGSGSADAETLLKQTFTGTHDIRSGRADIDLRVVATGDPSIRGPIQLSIAGPFQSEGSDQLPRFDLSLDVHAQGQGFEAGITSTSDQLFVNFGGTSYEVPSQLLDQIKQSYARSQDEQGSSQQMDLAGLGLDPLSWLQDPQVDGTATVGGVETDHITARLDVSALLDDIDKVLAEVRDNPALAGTPGQQLPSSIPSDTRTQIEDAVKAADVDVWTGTEDHTLRKLTIALTVEPPASSSGPRSLDVSLTVALSGINEPQTIEAPSTSRPLDELLGQLQGLLGGALGGDALGGGSSSGGGGATSDQLEAYTRCVQEAGADVPRAQECASLLTR